MAPKDKNKKPPQKDKGKAVEEGSSSTGKLKAANSINVRHILRPDETQNHPRSDHGQCEKHSKKEEALVKLRDGAKFDDVAREFSEDKARQGGSLGWKIRGSLIKAFEDVAYTLEPSTTASPKYGEAKTSEGYHIIMSNPADYYYYRRVFDGPRRRQK